MASVGGQQVSSPIGRRSIPVHAGVASGHNPCVSDSSLFCGIDLAQRIEAAEASLIVAATAAAKDRGGWGVVMPLAGGFACAAEAGSPMNKVVGLGFGGPVASSALDE